jgi:hypothetical protein
MSADLDLHDVSLMTPSIETTYERLIKWCRDRDYTGYDPFDGLNSKLFQASPLKHSRVARLAWLQFFKRSPINFRRIALVPPGKNPKGLALFALAALSRYRATREGSHATEAVELLKQLLALKCERVNGIAWGYNFDWQNRAFLAPRGTPTIVPTAFAARAFHEAALVLGEPAYKMIVADCTQFILSELNVTAESADEICWSYSPLDRTRVFNASLLAAETLAYASNVTGEVAHKDLASRGALYVARRQEKDGSWAYGADSFQTWSDNFHTAFILTSLSRIIRFCGDPTGELSDSLERGFSNWAHRFFDENGWPRYYPDSLYPADAHSTGAALIAFAELVRSNALARRTAEWAIENLLSAQGYFYYQRRRFLTVRIPYMRWAEAWMCYGLARNLEMNSNASDEIPGPPQTHAEDSLAAESSMNVITG